MELTLKYIGRKYENIPRYNIVIQYMVRLCPNMTDYSPTGVNINPYLKVIWV